MGTSQIFAIDREESRLEMARAQGARVINFEEEDPVETIFSLTGNIGVDRVIEAVGVDAEPPNSGPAAEQSAQPEGQARDEPSQVAPERTRMGVSGSPGRPRRSLLSGRPSASKRSAP
jgi:threonine dehydrogenase-like Zn-dependent dehydrogenase